MKRSSKHLIALIFLVLFSFSPFKSQPNQQEYKIDSLLTVLDTAEHTTRVNLLNKLSKEFEFRKPKKSYEYAEEAVRLAEEIDYKEGLAYGYMNIANYYTEQGAYDNAIKYFEYSLDVYKKIGDVSGEQSILNNIGNVHRYLGNYDEALEYFFISLTMSEETDDKQGIAYTLNNIGIIYAIQGNYDKVLEYFNRTLELSEEIGDKQGAASSLNNIGLVYEELGDYDKALESHEESLRIKEKIGNKNGISSSLKNIGNIYFQMGKLEDALGSQLQALEIEKEIGNKNGMTHSAIAIGDIYVEKKELNIALEYYGKAISLAEEIQAKDLIKDSYERLSELYEMKNDAGRALDYYKLYAAMKDSLFNETSSERMAEIQTKYETEKKEAEIELLKNEKTIQNLELDHLKNLGIYLTIILILAVLIAIIAYNRYRLKKKANILLEEKNRLEVENREKVLNMFGQQVSQEILDELLAESSETTKTIDELFTEPTDTTSKRKYVCVMFLDIREFTALVEKKEPEDIIAYQNAVFGFMIEIINKHHGVINQFMGDGYMATFGAPASWGNDCQNAVDAAIEIVKKVNAKSESRQIPATRIGIGLHSGNVVTGNVGTSLRKQYSITGNTVILASRIEQLNKKFNSQLLISEEVLHNIRLDGINPESLGPVVVKGREKPIHIYKLS
ncbi:MAG: tetratricopeptide repeat protein [Ignavibacterium sp.]|nr:MAG: tetratricopeptide repeat protein [Ignavibacterium sp.]